MNQKKNTTLNPTVVLLWRSLGPYHIARARAFAQFLKSKRFNLIVIELCGEEDTRDWETIHHDITFKIETLAPGIQLQANTPSMAGVLHRKLQEIMPCAIAVAGYDRPEMRKAMKWCKKNRAASILMSESKWDDRPRPWWKRMILKYCARLADTALVSGAAAGEYMVVLGMPRELIFRHYGAVDNDYFIKETTKLKEKKGDNANDLPAKYFLVCCRLIDSRKNILRLLSAYQVYRSQANGIKWQLVICGDGQDRGMLERFNNEQKIKGVIFAGFQQQENLVKYYAHAGCFIHPAINEAWGLVVNEAMAAGLPVLVSNRCGCAYDLVNDGENGFSFDPYNINELAEQMLKISLISKEKRKEMGQASQRQIQKWGTDRFAQGLWQAIQAVQAAPCAL